MNSNHPLRGFRFQLEIEGITGGAFTKVKGITRDVKVESYREGGVNDYVHQLVTHVSYPVIVLERGLALDDRLWKWIQNTADGKIDRKTLWIRLHNEANEKKWVWQIEHAIPVKWSATDLDARSSEVVIESLELAHHGLRKAR